ncbi:MAG: ABC transporter ATP-binding protein [Halodesulfurarchaeum sp.]|nr:ABC transporter ATP-binding protein [Halodesulfurarchaeum sp.]
MSSEPAHRSDFSQRSPADSARESPPGTDVAIQTSGLTKRYGDAVLAVDDLDLTVYAGEIFGFLGPNGAGKSTTIDVLMDYSRPTAGTATVLGMDSQRETRDIHRRVGILPDGYGLYDRLTGREHLEYAIDLKGADDDLDDLLDRVGLAPEAAARKTGGYSKGMGQRLALAIALVGDPDLLILDEPSSGLDPNGVRLVREIARDHADRGKTVFGSRRSGQVEAVCDRVAILDSGQPSSPWSPSTASGNSLGTGSTMTLTVEEVPADLSLDALAGVSTVSVDGRQIRVTVDEPEAKIAVIDRVREAGATLLDISTDEASLEDLFAASTGAGRSRTGETEGGR